MIDIMGAQSKRILRYIEEYRAYPAYHMNKKCWYSIFLDNALSDEEIITMLKASYDWYYQSFFKIRTSQSRCNISQTALDSSNTIHDTPLALRYSGGQLMPHISFKISQSYFQ